MGTNRRFTYIDGVYDAPPAMFNVTNNASITAADNQEDGFLTQRGDYFSVYQQCDAIQSLIFRRAATGWAIFDLDTNADSIEITQGITATATNMQFTVGSASDPGDAFYMKVTLKNPDFSIYDVAAIGFRKLAAYADVADQAALGTAYEDVAFLNLNGATATATSVDIVSVTRLAAGTADLDEEEADYAVDDTAISLEVYVTAAGVVTFKVDGSDVTGGANDLTLTDNAVMIPTMIFTATGDSNAIEAEIVSYECGLTQG